MERADGVIDVGVDVERFGQVFEQFLDRIVHGRARPQPLRDRVRLFLGEPLSAHAVTRESIPIVQRVNLQVALNAYLDDSNRNVDSVGLFSPNRQHEGVSFAQILQGEWGTPIEASPEYSEVDIGDGEIIACLDYGLHFVTEGNDRFIILVSKAAGFSPNPQQYLEVVAVNPAKTGNVLAAIRTLMRERNVYRGKVVRFEYNHQLGGVCATVQSLPSVSRSDLILPETTFERIERHVLTFGAHKAELLATGRHLRRGILLYGPPGTGKTHTISFLITAAKTSTTVLVSGTGFGLLPQAVALAADLQPAIVVMEDVDLVAEDRSMHQHGQTPLLFELLNLMDGLEADADIVFALTTNRIDVLESALVSRPGRIDLAVEIGRPDADGRRRLFELYSTGLDIAAVDVDALIASTDNVTASFVKELLRRAALMSAVDRTLPIVSQHHVDQALADLTEGSVGLFGAD